MKRRYLLLLVISPALVALLGLAACIPMGGGGIMGGDMMGGGMMGGGDIMGGGMMGNDDMMGGGMMGGGDMMGGMMGGGMMGGMMSGSMMEGMMGYYSGVPASLSHSNAKVIAEQYLASTNNADLEIEEFEEYSHNFYVSLIEKSTGRGAVEIIIDRYNGNVQPESQSMMWNSKYGMMGQYQTTEMTVTSEQARNTAQDFLDIVYPGTEADEMVAYYGYYTIMTTLEGEHYGMLSVNGYSGDVWYHTWHGMFISEAEFEH